jgi:hypothetical protein
LLELAGGKRLQATALLIIAPVLYLDKIHCTVFLRHNIDLALWTPPILLQNLVAPHF